MAGHASTPAGKRRAAARAKRAAPRSHKPRPAAGSRKPAKRASAKAQPRRRAHPAPKRKAAGAGRKARAPAGTPARAKSRRRGPLGRRPSLRTLLIVVPVVVAAVAGGYFGWLRDSSLVAVRDVQVKGVSGVEARRVTAALTDAARSMTTLHVDQDRLAAAVEGFPTVVSVSAEPDLLHGLTIEVVARPPALIAESNGDSVGVAADGTLLRGVELGSERKRLPTLAIDELPTSGKLEGEALPQALILGATPEALRPLIEDVSVSEDNGVEVALKGGIPVRFGDGTRAAAKWAAASAVLADPRLDTLTYLDVQVPARPAVGGASAVVPEEQPVAPVDPAL